MNHQDIELVIFDFDGVVVDSEIVFNEILAEEVTRLGWTLTTEQCFKQFCGMDAKSVDRLISENLNCPLPPHFRKWLNQRIEEALHARLKPIPHVDEILQSTPNKCIASSGEMSRILLSLEITQLLSHFPIDQIFNTQMVKYGKPKPDLFLFAAEKMGVLPQHCLVIEDSIYGIQAAHAAQMSVIGFTGGAHAREKEYLKKLQQMNPLMVTNDMRNILRYLTKGVT